MEEYKVPKQRARVTVELPPGAPEEGTVFLSPFADKHNGPETVHDLLARDEAFMPLVLASRGFLLVRKSAVRWLRVEEPQSAEWRFFELGAGAPQSRVRCRFADGAALEGVLRALTPRGEQRVLDVVNLCAGFLHLETAAGLHLVNLAHVATIDVLEESRDDS